MFAHYAGYSFDGFNSYVFLGTVDWARNARTECLLLAGAHSHFLCRYQPPRYRLLIDALYSTPLYLPSDIGCFLHPVTRQGCRIQHLLF